MTLFGSSDPLELRIHVPGRPPSPNANRRRHWSHDAAEIKRVRRDVQLLALEARGRRDGFPLARAEIELTFRLVAARGDLDNLLAGSKPIIDGLVDGGAIATDSVSCVAEIRLRWARGPQNAVDVLVRERRE